MPFPLPLTPFERYYLADDRADYPTTIPVELQFTGELDRPAFVAALQQVVARHPLLNATVAEGPDGPRWIAGACPDPRLDWETTDAELPSAPQVSEHLDLRQRPGLRVWVRVGPGRSTVWLQMHHACCDGLAVLDFVGDLLVLYAAANTKGTADLPPLDPERLTERAAFDAGPPRRPSPAVAARDAWMMLYVWWRILVRRCAVLASAAPRPSAASDPLSFQILVMPRAPSEQYKGVARARQVTVNDLLLRDMLLTVQTWNSAHGRRRTGLCRINMPVYVRDRKAAPIPASNGIGFGFVTVSPDKHAGPGPLLSAVHRETQRIKNWKQALYFLAGLAIGNRRPRLMKWALGRPRSLATVVLSYLGPALARTPLPRRDDGKLRCGNIVLEHIAGVPPVRPLTRASMVVLEYAGELTLGLRCDPHDFAPENTRELLQAFRSLTYETIRTGE
ncbi:MAG: condensation domain-containing protein [Pirellulales bacterium]